MFIHVCETDRFQDDSALENCASCSLGVRMYTRKAELFHLPTVRIVESSMPALAAVVAAPILKLWPAN